MLRPLLLVLMCQQISSFQDFLMILNDTKNSLSLECQKGYWQFFQNFSLQPDSWALQMFDSSSKFPSGILQYNGGEIGNFDQCINIEAENMLGKYCLGILTINLTNFKIPNSVALPSWALCLPHSCKAKDANILAETMFAKLFQLENFTIIFSDQLCQTIKEVRRVLSPGAITTISILVILTTSILICSCYDIHCTLIKNKPCSMVVQGLSIYSNSKKIFKLRAPHPDQIPCIEGIKFFSMIWVTMGHQSAIQFAGPIFNLKSALNWMNSLHSMVIISGTLAVDSFFTIAGILMAFGFLKAKQKKVPINIGLYYLHRYLRLTAPLALVVLVSATLLEYMGSGPRWPLLYKNFHENCGNYWWSTILYIQNYVNLGSVCLSQTWYLNVDMQLYIISPFLFYFLWKYPKYALPFLVFLGMLSMGLSFYSAWTNNLTALLTNFYGSDHSTFENKYYLLTYTRATPWFIGTIIGYYIFKLKYHQRKLRINRVIVLLLWILCFGTMIACVLGGHSTLRDPVYNKWGNVLYFTFVRPSWSVAIAWITLACVNDYGGPINWFLSLPIFQVFNKFIYSLYLIHVPLLYVVVFNRKYPDFFSDLQMAFEFWGTLAYSAMFSVILVYLTESPAIVLEKSLFGILKQQKRQYEVDQGITNNGFEK